MIIPMNELDIIKAVKKDKALPEGGVWRTIKGHKIYIKDGEILAGHVPGVTDKADFKKLVSKPAAKKPATAKKTASEAKKPAVKKAPASEAPKQTKAQAEAAKARKAIDDIANSRPKEPKKKNIKEAMAESKKATDEAIKKPNAKSKQGKGATKEDLAKIVKDNEAAKAKEKKGKGATKADLDKLAAENAKNKKTPKPVTKADLDEMFDVKPKKPAKKEVAVIRSEKQTNNEVAYDVGKKIGGARKDIAAQEKAIEALMGRKSGQSLEDLEKIAPELAQKHCIKKNLLPPLDFAAEHKAGTDINVAMAKQLIYDRIVPKPTGDTKIDRQQYMEAIRNLQRVIEPIKSWDELKQACRNLGDRMKLELPKHEKDYIGYLDYAKKKLAEPITDHDRKKYDYKTNAWVPVSDKEVMAERLKSVQDREARLKAIAEAKKDPYSPLGEKLLNFFTDSDSRNRTFDTVGKKNLSWDTYFKEDTASEEKKPKKMTSKQKWERVMPSVIKRVGGRTSKVEKPEDMVKNFNFSGVEFGNWIDDSSGNFHMKKCAESFMDLADIIGIKDKDVSFNGKLSMAFGARGQGFALAHYEPASKAINITKEGGAGSLAHEWGHAMDNILYQASVGHSSLNLASDGLGDEGSTEVKAAYKDLMHSIIFGNGLGKDTVPNKHNTFYSYHRGFKTAVEELGLNGAIKLATEQLNAKHQQSLAYYNDSVRKNYGDDTADKYIEKAERKHKMALNEMLQEMAYHHETVTGQKIDEIPAFTGHSQYYVDSGKQAKSSDYWTSNREMFARAFENYIEGKMKSGKVKNDYLVHGTYATLPGVAAPYPQGEERDAIHKNFDKLMEAVRKSGAIQKGLSFDIEKGIAVDTTKPVTYFGQSNRNAYNVSDTSEVFFIPVNRLKCNYQTEAALNFDKIRENVERMKAGGNLEPVIIGYDYDVHDGHHRIEASKIMKYTHVPCIVGGSNEIAVERAKEAYADVWKSIIFEQLDPSQFPYEATGHMFRGIGQKEMNFICEHGCIQSKGKGNDDDQQCAVTCFSNLFAQAEGYARSQFDLYGESQAYVIAVERPLASEENDLGEIEVAGKIPVDMIRGVIAVQNPSIELHKGLKEDVESIDLAGEKQAILDYSERIKGITDPKVKKIIAEIIKDEKNHAHNLKCIIAYINGDNSALEEDKLQKSYDMEGGVWRTINGKRVFIKDKGLQKSFEESDHPRDEQGRFSVKSTVDPKEWKNWSEGGHIASDNLTLPGGELKIMLNSPYAEGKHSVYKTWVDEDQRKQGIGSRLIQEAVKKYGDNLVAQTSSLHSTGLYYKHGFRPSKNPNATLEETLQMFKDDGASSLGMEYIKEDLTKAVKKDPLPEGGVWRTMNGHKVYIKDGEVLAGNIPGVTDKKSSPKSTSEAVQNPDKRMYSNNKRGTQTTDPQNKKGVSSMNKEGAGTNGKTRGTIEGNNSEARPNGQGSSRGTGEKGLGQEKGRSSSEGFFLEYHKDVDHKAFHSAISKAKSNNDHGAFVDLHDLEDYSKDKLLMSPQGGAGVAITPDGNIISVFKDPASNEKKAMHSIMLNAIQQGGKKLDCFDGYLPTNYARYGMVPVARLKFNKEYAPEGWNFERDGEPDVVFMAHNGDSFDQVLSNFGSYPMPDIDKVPYVEEYDDGISAQDRFMEERSAKKQVAATA